MTTQKFNPYAHTLDELELCFTQYNRLKGNLWNICNDYAQTLTRVKEKGDEFHDFSLIDGKICLFFVDEEQEPCITYSTVTIEELFKSQRN